MSCTSLQYDDKNVFVFVCMNNVVYIIGIVRTFNSFWNIVHRSVGHYQISLVHPEHIVSSLFAITQLRNQSTLRDISLLIFTKSKPTSISTMIEECFCVAENSINIMNIEIPYSDFYRKSCFGQNGFLHN